LKKHLYSIWALVVFILSVNINAQVSKNKVNTKYIDTIDLVSHIKYLASNELAGRMTGEDGLEKAASYIENQFGKFGLKSIMDGSYRQPFDLYFIRFENVLVKTKQMQYKNLDQMVYMETATIFPGTQKELVYTRTIDPSILAQFDLNDKILAILSDNIYEVYQYYDYLKSKGVYGIFAANPSYERQFETIRTNFERYRFNSKRLYLDTKNNDKKISTVEGETQKYFIFTTKALASLFGMEPEELQDLELGSNYSNYPKTNISLSCERNRHKVETANIVGMIPGTNANAKYIVITAHYDHVGTNIENQVYSGADDNASGVAAMLEIIENMIKNKLKPKNHILFLATSAEESGLLGAKYFYSAWPINKKTIAANINLDMIGRFDNINKKNTNFIYTYGLEKYKQLKPYFEAALKNTDLRHEKTLEFTDESGNSDHAVFMSNDIPAIFFHSGLHPDYHTPNDTWDKINYNLLKKRTELIFHTIWQIANASF
jgi:hypothetical protein